MSYRKKYSRKQSKHWLEKIVLALILLLSSLCHAESYYAYAIKVADDEIGLYEMCEKRQGEMLVYESRSILEFPGWLKKSIVVSSKGREEYNRDFVLQSLENTVNEDGKVIWSSMKMRDKEYFSTRSQLKSEQEKKADQDNADATELVSLAVPLAGQIVSIGGALLADGDSTVSSRVKLNSFDVSMNSLADYWKHNQYKFPSALRIIDGDSLSIKTFYIEPLTGDKTFRDSYKFDTKSGESFTLGFDGKDIDKPFIKHLSGVDGDEKYSLEFLSSINKEPKAEETDFAKSCKNA